MCLQFLDIGVDEVDEAHERWVAANGRVYERKQKERDLAKRKQEIVIDGDDADVADIDKLFAEKKQGSHMLELEFEPAGDPEEYVSSRTQKTTMCWTWKHKLTGAVIRRYKTNSGKAWDTGKLSLYLTNLKESHHKIAFQRARHILKLNCKHFIREPKNSDRACPRRIFCMIVQKILLDPVTPSGRLFYIILQRVLCAHVEICAINMLMFPHSHVVSTCSCMLQLYQKQFAVACRILLYQALYT